MGMIAIGDKVTYAALQDRTDVLQQQQKMDYSSNGYMFNVEDLHNINNDTEPFGKSPQPYSRDEIMVIIEEQLEEFFEVEAWSAVCCIFPPYQPSLTKL